jgi:hypothetical protein
MRDPDRDFDFNRHDSDSSSGNERIDDRVRKDDDYFFGLDDARDDRATPPDPLVRARQYPASPPPVLPSVSIPDPGTAVERHQDAINSLKNKYGGRLGFFRSNEVAQILSNADADNAKIETLFRRQALVLVRETQLHALQQTANSWLTVGAATNQKDLSNFLGDQLMAFQYELEQRERRFDAYYDECEAHIRTIANPRRRQYKQIQLESAWTAYERMVTILTQKYMEIIEKDAHAISGRSFSFD